MRYRSRLVTLAGFLGPNCARSSTPSPRVSSDQAARSPCPLERAEQLEGVHGPRQIAAADRLWAVEGDGAGLPRRRR